MSGISWQDLFATGSVIDMDVGQWDRMANFKPGDLGIEETEEVRAAFTWGHVKLIPDSYIKPLRKLIALAKRALESRTVYFPLIHGARFVPASEREELEGELAGIRDSMSEAVEELLSNYDKAKEEQRDVLVDAFEKACKDSASATASIARIPEMYPPPSRIRERFYLTWRVYSLASPIDGLSQDLQAEAVSVKSALSEMLGRLRSELQTRSQDIVELIVKGGKISEKTYNSTRRVCDKIDAITRTLKDPALINASAALRRAVESAAESDDDQARNRLLRSGFDEVRRELSVSVEKAVASIEADLTAVGRRKLAL